jgi:hypothetical protein
MGPIQALDYTFVTDVWLMQPPSLLDADVPGCRCSQRLQPYALLRRHVLSVRLDGELPSLLSRRVLLLLLLHEPVRSALLDMFHSDFT